jgi:hypothetical protein
MWRSLHGKYSIREKFTKNASDKKKQRVFLRKYLMRVSMCVCVCVCERERERERER